MNKGYLCTSDTTIIADEKGEQVITEYCDNIDEILVQENVIEKIEQDKNRFKKVLDDVLRIIGRNEYKIKYLQKFFQTYVSIETNKQITKLNQKELDKNYEEEFHFEFESKANKQIINIYLKRPF